MARQSSVPEEILRHVPCKCCRVRKEGNIYRVYKYKAIKLPSGKWSSDYGVLIGKIIPGKGFCPNKRYHEIVQDNDTPIISDRMCVLEYGQYALLIFLALDVYAMLDICFSADVAAQIFCYGIILCANGFIHVDQVNEYYIQSIMSSMFADFSFKMGYAALATLLHKLGTETDPVREFEQRLIDSSSKNIAIDGHVIRSCSNENDLAEPGYKARELKSSQVNVLIAYDTKSRSPLTVQTYRGSSVDKSSVIGVLQSRSFVDVKFVVDKGFYSTEVLSLMSTNGNTYIIPLPSSSKVFKRIKATLKFSSGEFVHVSGKTTSRVAYYEERIDSTTRVIAYMDIDENNAKRKSFRLHMAHNEDDYTEENYEKYKDWWGVYFLQTTTTESAAEVYADYKDRWSIETYNNYLKNDASFVNLKQQDYYAQHGFDFIMLITGMIHVRLRDAVQGLGKDSISTIDILSKARALKVSLDKDDVWRLVNKRTAELAEFKKMGFIPVDSFRSSEDLLRQTFG